MKFFWATHTTDQIIKLPQKKFWIRSALDSRTIFLITVNVQLIDFVKLKDNKIIIQIMLCDVMHCTLKQM